MTSDELPAIYGGTPPAHTYDSPDELAALKKLSKLTLALVNDLSAMLCTYGWPGDKGSGGQPKPDMEIAMWQEDADQMHRLLVRRMASVEETIKIKRLRRRERRSA